ncbi:NACHT and WD repeat domain-containing protein 2 isoform X1 [Tachypleus tridentatus]|uniref:NACHT and WD repeat domain-containing protein 2 isoform X1 n=2 Tax=Tachypleus tridentatus TaxID=6853 RepID=UPI003FD65953
MDERAIDKIFAGCLDELPPVSSKIVRIFTSSTFTDMSMERNTLMEEVYPRIKEYCRERHGLEFQVVDMRWGVRDEATDDHMTTELCMNEIKNCQRVSMGPNFVVFLAQKYGYRPIPTKIDAKEFLLLRDALVSIGTDVSLLDKWYQEDTNSVPSEYVLQPISSILFNFNNKRVPKLQAQDQATWWDTLSKLQKLLRKAAQSLHTAGKLDDEATHNYMMSVTEREVINGILNTRNTRSHCLAYVRQINNINMANLRVASQFIDISNRTVDAEAQKLLSNLRDERLPAKIEHPNYIKYTVEWSGKDGLNPEAHKDYLKHFTSHFYRHIIKLVDRAMRKEDLSSQGQIVTEILQHLHACNNAVQIFQGRKEELEAIRQYIKGSSDQPYILHGEGGCGKTSLLAKAASMVPLWCGQEIKPVIILRFLGTTPDSSSIVPMLTSICEQISYNFILPWTDIPDDLVPLIAFLKRLLAQVTKEQPLYIFIDSIDQLSGPNEANKLSWLPTHLPPYVKMVVSSVSGDSKDYRLIQRMLENSEQFLEVKPLGVDLAITVIQSWLKGVCRDLNAYQWKVVRSALVRCSLPIFVKLVFAEICRWKSYSKATETTLASTVMDSIMKLLDRIEMQHGKTLVFHALAYITASKSGLSESELEDLISLDDKVLDDIYQYHLPPVRRIPPLLWTRIRNDLPNYLTEREADGVSVLNWYHRQFREAALERYFKNLNAVSYFHSCIADYFLGIWGGGNPKPFKYTEIQRHRFGISGKEGQADRKVPLQPLVFYSNDGRVARYNLRKFGEMAFHLIRSRRFDDLFEHVLFNYQWLHSKMSSCPIQAVVADFEDAREYLTEKEAMREVILVADAIRLGGAILSQYPHMLASQVVGRLLPVKDMHKNVSSLIKQCDELGPQHCALIPAYHCLHTPGGPLKYSLEGHQFAIFGFALTSDLRYVLSVSNRFIMWDLSTGEVTRDINPNIQGIMQTLALSPDDKFAVTFTNYDEILILNLLIGEVQSLKETFPPEEHLVGVSITETFLAVWTEKNWCIFSLATGKKKDSRELLDVNYSIISVIFVSLAEYHIALRASDGEECDIMLCTVIRGRKLTDLKLCGGLVFNKEKDLVFISERNDSGYDVMVYKIHTDGWIYEQNIATNANRVLELSLTPEDRFLVAIQVCGFTLWDLNENRKLTLELPHGVRNISTKPLHSQSSLVLTRYNQYAIGGVRKNLYVWDTTEGQILKVLDAHFGRILHLEPLIIDEFNGIVSSSIDRTIKVWNINNIFEQVHLMDRMEMPIDSISISKTGEIAITVTRSCVGIWCLSTGKLWAKLADSPVGAIVTHAVITNNSRYVVSVETGHVLLWSLEKACVAWRHEQKNVRQLLLMMEDTRVLAVSLITDSEAKCVVRKLPEGNIAYSFNFPVLLFKAAVISTDGHYLVLVSMEKGRECISVHQVKNGVLLHKIPLKLNLIRGFSHICAYPAKGYLIALVGTDRSHVIDVKTRKFVRSVNKWNGCSTTEGKYGLYAPSRGGLELLELRHGNTVHMLLPRVSEGVFSVTTLFTTNNEYVVYYHSGRKTIRLFRVTDGKMIANYRLSAESSCINSTPDGKSLVVGAVDGSVIVLVIVDPMNPECQEHLMSLPSRTSDGPHVGKSIMTFRTTAHMIAIAARSKLSGQDDNQPSRTCVLS